MATGRTVLRAVMKFARDSSMFQSPATPDEPISPALDSLPDATYSKVWIDIHNFLRNDEGIPTDMPIGIMRKQVTWRALANLAFDRQPGGQ